MPSDLAMRLIKRNYALDDTFNPKPKRKKGKAEDCLNLSESYITSFRFTDTSFFRFHKLKP